MFCCKNLLKFDCCVSRKFSSSSAALKKADIPVDGKVIIITGCNTGIGKETALDLARRGATLHMACRNYEKCEATRQDIIEKTGNNNVFNWELDLASLDSIRKFVRKFRQEQPRLDVLINNAGVMAIPRSLTNDGFEMQIGVNHMGHFLLTNLLLDMLKQSAPSRIVVVASLAYKFGVINRNDLNSEQNYNKFAAYSQSKLANILFTRELSKRLVGTGVIVNACHPGIVQTKLGRHVVPAGFMKRIVRPVAKMIMKSPREGAQNSVLLAIHPEIENISGKYFSDCKERSLASRALDDETAEWLWRTSEQWTGLTTTENLTEAAIHTHL